MDTHVPSFNDDQRLSTNATLVVETERTLAFGTVKILLGYTNNSQVFREMANGHLQGTKDGRRMGFPVSQFIRTGFNSAAIDAADDKYKIFYRNNNARAGKRLREKRVAKEAAFNDQARVERDHCGDIQKPFYRSEAQFAEDKKFFEGERQRAREDKYFNEGLGRFKYAVVTYYLPSYIAIIGETREAAQALANGMVDAGWTCNFPMVAIPDCEYYRRLNYTSDRTAVLIYDVAGTDLSEHCDFVIYTSDGKRGLVTKIPKGLSAPHDKHPIRVGLVLCLNDMPRTPATPGKPSALKQTVVRHPVSKRFAPEAIPAVRGRPVGSKTRAPTTAEAPSPTTSEAEDTVVRARRGQMKARWISRDTLKSSPKTEQG